MASAEQWVGRLCYGPSRDHSVSRSLQQRADGHSAILERSVGGVGISDRWQDFNRHGAMTWHYARAGPGELASLAQLCGSGTLALGLSSSREAAATLAVASLSNGFERAWRSYCDGWHDWLRAIQWPPTTSVSLTPAVQRLLRRSAVVIRCHEDRIFRRVCCEPVCSLGETTAAAVGITSFWPVI